MTVMMTGMNAKTLACTGSGGVGLSLNCRNIAPPISSGRMKNGSREDRSWIQNMNGAWRISTLSSSTQ